MELWWEFALPKDKVFGPQKPTAQKHVRLVENGWDSAESEFTSEFKSGLHYLPAASFGTNSFTSVSLSEKQRVHLIRQWKYNQVSKAIAAQCTWQVTVNTHSHSMLWSLSHFVINPQLIAGLQHPRPYCWGLSHSCPLFWGEQTRKWDYAGKSGGTYSASFCNATPPTALFSESLSMSPL